MWANLSNSARGTGLARVNRPMNSESARLFEHAHLGWIQLEFPCVPSGATGLVARDVYPDDALAAVLLGEPEGVPGEVGHAADEADDYPHLNSLIPIYSPS